VTAPAIPSSSTTHQNTKTRRILPIEEALRWCVRDELPKRRNDDGLICGGGAPVHPMWAGGLFTKVDNWNREPGMPLALGDPSPDALVIESELLLLGQEIKRADAGLGQQPLDLSPYEIGHGLGPSVRVDPIIAKVRRDVVERIITLVRREAVSWLLTCAVKGGRPDHGGPAECESVKGTRGQVTLWLTVSAQAGAGPDGEPWFITTDQKTTPASGGVYRKGTFCKLHWVRDIDSVAEDRARYAVWHAALALLASRLKGLATLAVGPPAAPATPWISEPTPPTVLKSLLPANDPGPAPLSTAPLRPLPRPNSPVRKIDPATYPIAA
jgi:hypothetical protein